MKATERIEEIQAELKLIGPKWKEAKKVFDILNHEFQVLHAELHRLQRKHMAGMELPPAIKAEKRRKAKNRLSETKNREMLENLKKSSLPEAIKRQMAAQLGLKL